MLHLLPVLLLATPQVQLPESGAARALASVGPETEPLDLATELLEPHPWLVDAGRGSAAERTSTWAAWLGAEASAPGSAPAQRAGLTLLAAQESRHEDAWVHLAALTSSPGWAAAVLPTLLPGAPVDSALSAGGLPGPLPDGVLLRPAPPPPAPGDPLQSLRPREAHVRGLRIGEAQVDLRVAIEPSGIQVDLTHTGGGPATVRVLLPEPEGQEIRVEYVDWMRQDNLREPLLVELSPEDEEPHTLWGRFLPRRAPLPNLPTGGLPRGLTRGGLFLRCSEELEDEARAFAEAVGELYGFPTGVLRPGTAPPAPGARPLVATLPPAPEGRRVLRDLTRLVERHRLGSPFLR